jgi:Helix-turn-helix domain
MPKSPPPKVGEAADAVRKMIASGELAPGGFAPRAPALSAATGTCLAYCQRALRLLVEDGTLVLPASRSGRPRVPGGGGPGPAERAMAAALGAARRAAGLTQEELAAAAGLSVTAVSHAETGQVRLSPAAWARLDDAAGAGGALVRAHERARPLELLDRVPAGAYLVGRAPDGAWWAARGGGGGHVATGASAAEAVARAAGENGGKG